MGAKVVEIKISQIGSYTNNSQKDIREGIARPCEFMRQLIDENFDD
ncbi:MAG: hypothetical protein GQ470_04880 [Gammaproteobacteria bacterium]|nr:hypothetical protein [Gammaproteobacteria bacterium]